MALSLGSALATKVYLGATEVSLAYLGATQVYTSSAFSAEATNYFSRLDAAGDTTYVDYKQPLANYIDSLVSLGGAYWDTMLSSTSFVGVGIQGVTVPLRDGMTVPTNNNFVAGDLDQLTGLKGDGSTKYLATGLIGTDFTQDDVSLSVYITAPATGFYAGSNTNDTGIYLREASFALNSSAFGAALGIGTTPTGGLIGVSRDNSADFDIRSNQTNFTEVVASNSALSYELTVFAVRGLAPMGARLTTYHAGPALNLATLEALQDTLITEIAAI